MFKDPDILFTTQKRINLVFFGQFHGIGNFCNVRERKKIIKKWVFSLRDTKLLCCRLVESLHSHLAELSIFINLKLLGTREMKVAKVPDFQSLERERESQMYRHFCKLGVALL